MTSIEIRDGKLLRIAILRLIKMHKSRLGMKYDQCHKLLEEQSVKETTVHKKQINDVCELVNCDDIKARSLCPEVCSKSEYIMFHSFDIF